MIFSPFPGMDPYLESPAIWHSLHTRLNTIWADELAAKLAPDYIANLETEIVIEHVDAGAEHEINGNQNGGQQGATQKAKVVAIPDVAIRQPETASTEYTTAESPTVAPLQLRVPMPIERRLARVSIIHHASGTLVTVIELLSPVNKRNGQQRRKYLHKREMYLDSPVHLVEIDLLRRWERMPLEGELPASDYLVMVSDAQKRPTVDVWPLRVPDALPVITIPLLPPDAPTTLDLGESLRTAYQRGRYDLQIDYDQPPIPPLPEETAKWAEKLVVQWKASNG